jgi:hypothetical protein
VCRLAWGQPFCRLPRDPLRQTGVTWPARRKGILFNPIVLNPKGTRHHCLW